MSNQEDSEGGVPCEENREREEISLTEDESGAFHLELDDETTEEKLSSTKSSVILRGESEQKEQEAKKRDDRYLYLLADFENYKKRVQKEQLDQAKYANEKLLREVLIVLDDLERAILHFNETHDFEKVSEGLALVSKQFLSFLNRFGVSPIESLNKPFDPACHQAVGQVERPDLKEGNVADEIQKGYMLHGRLIRPSFVMIAKHHNDADIQGNTVGGTVNVGV